MKYSLVFTAVITAANLCFTTAAPTPEEEEVGVAVSDIENPDGDEVGGPEVGHGRQVWKCHDEIPTIPGLDYAQCQTSINAFAQTYPEMTGSDKYTLTHRAPPTRPGPVTNMYCPVSLRPDRPRNLCEFVFDYHVYPKDKDQYSDLKYVKWNMESLIRKCERAGKHAGGTMDVLWGSWKYKMELNQKMPSENEESNGGIFPVA